MRLASHSVVYGPPYNNVMHLIAYHLYKNVQFDPNILESWSLLLHDIARYLPDQSDRDIFRVYLEENPPGGDEIKSFEDVWKWSVDHHNSLNVLTGTPKFTYEVAEESVQFRNLLSLKKNFTLYEHFSTEVWCMLAITASVMDPNEEEAYIAFLTRFFRLVPFGSKVVNDKTIADMLISKLDEVKLDSRDNAVNAICDLRNLASVHFDSKMFSHEEWNYMLMGLFGNVSRMIDLYQRHAEKVSVCHLLGQQKASKGIWKSIKKILK